MKNNIITLIYLIVLSLISTACGSPTPLATGQLIPTTVPVKLTQTNIPIQPPTNIPAANFPSCNRSGDTSIDKLSRPQPWLHL